MKYCDRIKDFSGTIYAKSSASVAAAKEEGERRRPPRPHRTPDRPASSAVTAASSSAPTRQQQQKQQQHPQNESATTTKMALIFKKKVQSANRATICNTTSAKVGRIPLCQLLTRDTFCVPIFQRRYCWTETQWQTLLDDAAARSGGSGSTMHSLGRLTCTGSHRGGGGSGKEEGRNKRLGRDGDELGGRSCILDGQQRFTTVTILLATIRDLLEEQRQQQQQQTQYEELGEDYSKTIDSVNELVFCDSTEMKAWMMNDDEVLDEGCVLPFARLVPTYCDRWSYYSAILPVMCASKTKNILIPPREEESETSSWHGPLQAKQYYLTTLRQDFASSAQLSTLLSNILNIMTMLYFPIDIHVGRDDGTEDLMVIYERLALRDATFCKPRRGEEYMPMSGADMIRNLLLGSFADPTDAVGFYRDYWLPMERVVEASGITIYQALEAFLDSQPSTTSRSDITLDDLKGAATLVGGPIYARFQTWFNLRTCTDTEDGVLRVGKELLSFAHTLLG